MMFKVTLEDGTCPAEASPIVNAVSAREAAEEWCRQLDKASNLSIAAGKWHPVVQVRNLHTGYGHDETTFWIVKGVMVATYTASPQQKEREKQPPRCQQCDHFKTRDDGSHYCDESSPAWKIAAKTDMACEWWKERT
jgi:hypothetical protein